MLSWEHASCCTDRVSKELLTSFVLCACCAAFSICNMVFVHCCI